MLYYSELLHERKKLQKKKRKEIRGPEYWARQYQKNQPRIFSWLVPKAYHEQGLTKEAILQARTELEKFAGREYSQGEFLALGLLYFLHNWKKILKEMKQEAKNANE